MLFFHIKTWEIKQKSLTTTARPFRHDYFLWPLRVIWSWKRPVGHPESNTITIEVFFCEYMSRIDMKCRWHLIFLWMQVLSWLDNAPVFWYSSSWPAARWNLSGMENYSTHVYEFQGPHFVHYLLLVFPLPLSF